MPTPPYHTTRRLGDAAITAISEAQVDVPAAQVFPPAEVAYLRARGEVDAAGNITTDQIVIVVQLGDAVVVIDPAFDDPGTPWSAGFATRWPRVDRTPGVAAALADLGIDPAAVTHVPLTHAHDDHFAGTIRGDAPRFPNARHLLGRGDWAGNPRRAETGGDFATRLARLHTLGLLDLVEGDREIAPGITLLHAPGETPGHQIVRVRSGGETFYALGDLFHHGCEVAHPDWFSPWVDGTAMLPARRRFLATLAAEHALTIFTHEPFAPWGRILPDGDGYRWERES